LNYLRPVDYYEGNPEALLTEWKKRSAVGGKRGQKVTSLKTFPRSYSGGMLY